MTLLGWVVFAGNIMTERQPVTVTAIGQPSPVAMKGQKKPNLSNEERRAVYEYLLTKLKSLVEHGKLIKGALTAAAERFGMTADTISIIWK